MAAVDNPAALPQRPPRGRRHAAASGAATLKRSRDQDDADEDRRRRTDAAECAAATTRDAGGDTEEVTVTWSACSEKPPGEAADGQHCFEYLDHTADIQLHSWAETVEAAFGWSALAMFNYMTPLAGFEEEELDTVHEVHVSAHDMQSLLFAFLDELLFLFHTESLVVRQLRLRKLNRGGNSDPEHPWALTASASGSRFVPGTHEPGTEVKAITYSAMQILERERADVYVIVDI